MARSSSALAFLFLTVAILAALSSPSLAKKNKPKVKKFSGSSFKGVTVQGGTTKRAARKISVQIKKAKRKSKKAAKAAKAVQAAALNAPKTASAVGSDTCDRNLKRTINVAVAFSSELCAEKGNDIDVARQAVEDIMTDASEIMYGACIELNTTIVVENCSESAEYWDILDDFVSDEEKNSKTALSAISQLWRRGPYDDTDIHAVLYIPGKSGFYFNIPGFTNPKSLCHPRFKVAYATRCEPKNVAHILAHMIGVEHDETGVMIENIHEEYFSDFSEDSIASLEHLVRNEYTYDGCLVEKSPLQCSEAFAENEGLECHSDDLATIMITSTNGLKLSMTQENGNFALTLERMGTAVITELEWKVSLDGTLDVLEFEGRSDPIGTPLTEITGGWKPEDYLLAKTENTCCGQMLYVYAFVRFQYNAGTTTIPGFLYIDEPYEYEVECTQCADDEILERMSFFKKCPECKSS